MRGGSLNAFPDPRPGLTATSESCTSFDHTLTVAGAFAVPRTTVDFKILVVAAGPVRIFFHSVRRRAMLKVATSNAEATIKEPSGIAIRSMLPSSPLQISFIPLLSILQSRRGKMRVRGQGSD
jgi:hypothetical protein